MSSRAFPIIVDEVIVIPDDDFESGVDTPHSPPPAAAAVAAPVLPPPIPDHNPEITALAAIFIHVLVVIYEGTGYTALWRAMRDVLEDPSLMGLSHVLSFLPQLRHHMANLTSALQSRNSPDWLNNNDVLVIRTGYIHLLGILADVGRVFAFVSARIPGMMRVGEGDDLLPPAAAIFEIPVEEPGDDEDEEDLPGFVASDNDSEPDDSMDEDFVDEDVAEVD